VVHFGKNVRDVAAAADLLAAHLRSYLGTWPPRQEVEVIAWPGREEPAWDGALVPAVVVASPEGTVVSVVPSALDATSSAVVGATREDLRLRLGMAVGVGERVSPWVVLRWSGEPAPLEPVGLWVPSSSDGLPEWLKAFPGNVLATFDDETGEYAGGVGIKRHTAWGHELAVGTAEDQRGKGLARRLVAQAGRDVLATGALPLYVHDANNVPSAKVADAAGFPDLGWRLLVAWGNRR
jgi:RimJ/RimL family protein N-acetyltransferase